MRRRSARSAAPDPCGSRRAADGARTRQTLATSRPPRRAAAPASVAQAWAARCLYQLDAGRGERGENIAASAPPGHWAASDVVAAWASEAQDYDYATNTCAPGKKCGHYTQLVWRDSVRVGCAHQVCDTNWPFAPSPPGRWDFWVCDYEPPGNRVGQKPY